MFIANNVFGNLNRTLTETAEERWGGGGAEKGGCKSIFFLGDGGRGGNGTSPPKQKHLLHRAYGHRHYTHAATAFTGSSQTVDN